MNLRPRQSLLSLILRSTIFNIVFFLSNLFGCVFCLGGLLLPRRGALFIVTTFFRYCYWLERVILGLTCEMRGRENLPEGCCILAFKHQSLWETYNLLVWFDDPAVILKRELMRIPLWGWYAQKVGMIPIDRGGGMKALLGMARAAEKVKAAGRKIIIFPQGTRLAPDAYKSYAIGIGVLAEQLQLPIVPVALNSGLYWPKRSFLKHAGTVLVEILPAIPPGKKPRDLVAELEAALEPASERLSLEAGGPAISSPSARHRDTACGAEASPPQSP